MFSEWVFGNRFGVSVLCQPLHIRKIHQQFHLAIQNQPCIDGWLSFGNSTQLLKMAHRNIVDVAITNGDFPFRKL